MAHYTAAIVGAGIGGLAAAALMSKMDRKVILLEPGASISGGLGVIEHDRFRCSLGQSLVFGFERGGALSGLASSLGIEYSSSVLSPCYQVLLPDRRISVSIDIHDTLVELRREFPRDIDRIVKFYRNLRRISERMARSKAVSALYRARRAGSFLRPFRFSAEFSAFLDIQARHFFRRPVNDISIPYLVTLFDSAPLSVHGGLLFFAEQMLEVVLRNGGEIRYGVPWPQLASAQKRSAVLQTDTGTIEAAAVLFNTQQEEGGTTLFIGVREDVLPVGMSREVLCLPDYGRPDEYFTLSVSSQEDERSAPRGMRCIVASFPHVRHGREEKERCMGLVEAVVPFLRQQLSFAEVGPRSDRTYTFSRDITFKRLRTREGRLVLHKAGTGGIFVLSDHEGAPADTARAAAAFAERFS